MLPGPGKTFINSTLAYAAEERRIACFAGLVAGISIVAIDSPNHRGNRQANRYSCAWGPGRRGDAQPRCGTPSVPSGRLIGHGDRREPGGGYQIAVLVNGTDLLQLAYRGDRYGRCVWRTPDAQASTLAHRLRWTDEAPSKAREAGDLRGDAVEMSVSGTFRRC